MNRDLMHIMRRGIIDSHRLREVAYSVLGSNALNRNRLYRELYSRRIAHLQRGLVSSPLTLSVETTNACNASCLMCGHRHMKRLAGSMSWELFRRVIDQAAAWPLELLYLSGFGEPLLDPGLEDRVAYAKSRGIRRTAIVTNASLLTPQRARRLSEAGLDRVHASIDGATPAAFSRLRPGLEFGRVMENIDGLLRMSPRPQVVVQVVLVDQGLREIADIRDRFGRRADRLVFRQAQDWAGLVPVRTGKASPHLSGRGSWPPCRYLWDQMNVYWNGTAPACCLDFEARSPLGDASRQDLSGIWKGSALAGLREKHNAGQRERIPLCRHCRYFSVWW